MISYHCTDRLMDLRNSQFPSTCDDLRFDHSRIVKHLKDESIKPENTDQKKKKLTLSPTSIYFFTTRDLKLKDKLDRKSFEEENTNSAQVLAM